MASVPDWTPDGYAFEGDGRSAERCAGQSSFIRRVHDSLRRLMRRSQTAPPAPKSLIYVLCEEYRQFDLWAAYHAFRLDPRARNWQRLRRRNVPWQSEQTVEGLLHRLCPVTGKRTPDPNTVGLALVTASFASRTASKKKRAS
jgi:hypothetical protein